MNDREAQSAIEALGWETEDDSVFTDTANKRAKQGNFFTPWRDDWQTVLADVKSDVKAQ